MVFNGDRPYAQSTIILCDTIVEHNTSDSSARQSTREVIVGTYIWPTNM